MLSRLINALRKEEIIYEDPVILASGKRSEFYVDIKKAYGNPLLLNLICRELWKVIDKRTTCIAGSGNGGISPASVLSSRYHIPLSIIRTTPKNHGRAVMIDGYEPNEKDFVTIIDDVFTTGGSLEKMGTILREYKPYRIEAKVVVRRENGVISIPAEHLVLLEDLL